MALSERSRTTIYTEFTRSLGEEAAAEMLAYFPARDTDEPVTRDYFRAGMADLRTEMADLRTDLRTEMADFKTELHAEMADFKTELHAEMADFKTKLHAEMAGFRSELHADMDGLRGDVKTDIARLEIALERGLRQQTIWTVSALAVFLAVFTVLNGLL